MLIGPKSVGSRQNHHWDEVQHHIGHPHSDNGLYNPGIAQRHPYGMKDVVEQKKIKPNKRPASNTKPYDSKLMIWELRLVMYTWLMIPLNNRPLGATAILSQKVVRSAIGQKTITSGKNPHILIPPFLMVVISWSLLARVNVSRIAVITEMQVDWKDN